jgi:hypothetical protein
MSKRNFKCTCPNCSQETSFTSIYLENPKFIKTYCSTCYYPIKFFPETCKTEIDSHDIRKKAFLIHSSDKKEKKHLDYFRGLMKLWGVETFVIENDARSVDWLQKSLDGISNTDFVLCFLTKRYQFANEAGEIIGWKAPDKCYEEIAIAFALQKQIVALVESKVDAGNVLNTRAWCFKFDRIQDENLPSPLRIELDYFIQIMMVIGVKSKSSL